MGRISLAPPRTLSYRIAEWFIRRRFGAMLDPVRATAHNMPVMKAFGALEQRAAKWNRLDAKIRDLADLAAAAKIGCSWCLDFGSWMMHTHGIPREKIEAVPQRRNSNVCRSTFRSRLHDTDDAWHRRREVSLRARHSEPSACWKRSRLLQRQL
jgi:AhpD family alkylhydroperoxidase